MKNIEILNTLRITRTFNECDCNISLNPNDLDGDGLDFKKDIFWEITDGEIVYGKMKIILIDSSFRDHHIIDDFNFYDCHSQALCNLYENAIEPYDIVCRFIHYLDRIEIKDKYKNLGIGSYVISRYIKRMVAYTDYFIVKPFPLKWEGKVNTDDDEKNLQIDLKRIQKFYTKYVGLDRLDNTEFYYHNGESIYEFPKIKLVTNK